MPKGYLSDVVGVAMDVNASYNILLLREAAEGSHRL